MSIASLLEAKGFLSGKTNNHSPALPSIQKSRIALSRSIFILIFSFVLAVGAHAQSYSGQASTARLTVTAVGQPVVTTAVADTGELPSTGGNITLASIGVNLSPVATVGSSTSTTQGSASASHSTGSINNVNIGILGNVITADAVSATSDAVCTGESLTGSSVITNLVINGSPIAVSGAPNQTITILQGATPVGTLTINEQVQTTRSITVNALHLNVTDPLSLTETDLVIASARSGINCGFSPSANLYSGRGTGIGVRQADILFGDVTTLIGDTGPLPTTGGSINATTAGADILSGLLNTGTVTSATSGGVPGGSVHSSQSSSSVEDLGIDLLAGAVTINATVLNSNTQCTCSIGVPTCTGSSTLTGLALEVLGLPVSVTVTGDANQVVNIPVLGLGSITLTLNGRESGGSADITAYPLRIQTSLAGLVATDIVVASSHSDIVCALAPTAAPASVTGRVFDPNGRPISKVVVTITDGSSFSGTAVTNSFGYYILNDVPAGGTYIISAQHKRYRFGSYLISVESDLSEVNFTSGVRSSPSNQGKPAGSGKSKSSM